MNITIREVTGHDINLDIEKDTIFWISATFHQWLGYVVIETYKGLFFYAKPADFKESILKSALSEKKKNDLLKWVDKHLDKEVEQMKRRD